MQEIEERSHVAEKLWAALEKDTISTDDYTRILEHTKSCTWCADRMAEILMQDVGLEAAVSKKADNMPPAYLTEQILERTRQPDVRAAVTIRQTSKKLQLLLYSLKVGAAVAFSILILGVTANFQDMDFTLPEKPALAQQRPVEQEDSLLDKMNDAVNGVTSKMNDFTNLLLNGGKKK